MDDKKLDQMLDAALDGPPPEDVVRAVSPWRHAMSQVLWGLALTSISLNFLLLNYILPSIGSALMLLGFRTLQANRHFRLAYFSAMLRCATQIAALFLASTVIRSETLDAVLVVLTALATFGITLGFWYGLLEARSGAGLERHAPAAGWLMLWYAVTYVLALISMAAGGSLSVVGILMLAAFVGIVVSLTRLSKQLDEAGYAVRTAQVRFTDGQLCALLALVAAAGIALGLLCFGRYDMDWEAQPARGEDAQAVAEKLLELGFPDYVLADLSDEDVLRCELAEQIAANVREFSLDDGSVLRSTGVAVRLPNEESWYEHWVLIQHLDWQGEASFRGTEGVELFATNRVGRWWLDPKNEPHMRLLCTEGGESYTAAPAAEERGRDGCTFRFGFSFPQGAQGARGYVCYGIQASSALTDTVYSHMNYRHQETILQYPVRTALEGGDAFRLFQDALEFYTTEEGEVRFVS